MRIYHLFNSKKSVSDVVCMVWSKVTENRDGFLIRTWRHVTAKRHAHAFSWCDFAAFLIELMINNTGCSYIGRIISSSMTNSAWFIKCLYIDIHCMYSSSFMIIVCDVTGLERLLESDGSCFEVQVVVSLWVKLLKKSWFCARYRPDNVTSVPWFDTRCLIQ